MKKLIAFVLSLTMLIAVFTLASCGGTTPTEAPTAAPTQAPTEAPTEAPTAAPPDAPTEAPTAAPTEAPTAAPTEEPETPAEARSPARLPDRRRAALRQTGGDISADHTPRSVRDQNALTFDPSDRTGNFVVDIRLGKSGGDGKYFSSFFPFRLALAEK